MIAAMNLSTLEKMYFTSNPLMAVIGAYATSKNDNNTWQWLERYKNMVEEGKHTLLCGDWSVFKDGREF